MFKETAMGTRDTAARNYTDYAISFLEAWIKIIFDREYSDTPV